MTQRRPMSISLGLLYLYRIASSSVLFANSLVGLTDSSSETRFIPQPQSSKPAISCSNRVDLPQSTIG